MTWRAIARSEIGTSHVESGIECQDFGACITFENIIIAAVADGAGSAKYSRKGAEIVVNTTLKYLQGFLKLQKTKKREPIGFNSIQVVQTIFRKLFKYILDQLRKEAESEDHDIREYASTLLVIVASSDWLAAMQIGDGFIVARSSEESSYKLLFPPDKGEFVNETTFVTSPNASEEMKIDFWSMALKFICVSTDGLERVAISTRDWTPGHRFFEPFEQYLCETENPEANDKYIVDFLKCSDLNARTDDDKTIFIGFYGDEFASKLEKPIALTESKIESSWDSMFLDFTIKFLMGWIIPYLLEDISESKFILLIQVLLLSALFTTTSCISLNKINKNIKTIKPIFLTFLWVIILSAGLLFGYMFYKFRG